MGLYNGKAPNLAVLVPSYKEDPTVVRKTLLSEALLDYPNKHVVLLIDDPSAPDNEADRALLQNARQLVIDLNTGFRHYAGPFWAALNDYTRRKQATRIDTAAEWHNIASLYDRAVQCLDEIQADTPNCNHEDRWFIEQNLLTPAAEDARLAWQEWINRPSPALEATAESHRREQVTESDVGEKAIYG